MKRFLGVLIATMFLASAAFAADETKEEKTTDAKAKAAEGKAKGEAKKAEGKAKGEEAKAAAKTKGEKTKGAKADEKKAEAAK